jgi:hypothetical protein
MTDRRSLRVSAASIVGVADLQPILGQLAASGVDRPPFADWHRLVQQRGRKQVSPEAGLPGPE